MGPLIICCKDLRVVCVTFNSKQPELIKRLLKAVTSLAFTQGTQPSTSFAYRFNLSFNPTLTPNG